MVRPAMLSALPCYPLGDASSIDVEDEPMPPSTSERIAALETALTRLVTIEESREDERRQTRELLASVPARLAKIEGQLDQLTQHIQQDSRSWDRWVAPEGYLRSRAFGGLVLAVLLGGGVLTVTDVTGMVARHILGIEAPASDDVKGMTP